MGGKHSYSEVNLAIVAIELAIKVRDSIPVKFTGSHALINEMNNDMYVQCDKINKMLKDIVCNGVDEDIPF